MSKRIFLAIAVVVGLAFLRALPQARADEFYKGKTIRFVVGFPPGGVTISLPGLSDGTWVNISPETPPSSLKT